MKPHLTLPILLLQFLVISTTSAQIITIDPVFPTRGDVVTITYDATQGSGGLIGVDQVYAHTGVITASGGPGNWQYVQGNWGTDDPNVKMTKIADNLHQITYQMESYYGVPESEEIVEMAFVFRNVDGSLEGKTADLGDIFTPVYSEDAEFLATFVTPQESNIILTQDDSLRVVVASSQIADMQLSVDQNVVSSISGKEIEYVYYPESTGNVQVAYRVSALGEVLEDSFTVVVNPPIEIAELPAGAQDGITRLDDSTARFVLYAPDKSFVYLLGEWGSFAADETGFMQRTPDGNRWWIEVTGLSPAEEYAYQYLVDGVIRIADPYATQVLDPFHDQFIPPTTYPDLKTYPENASGILGVMSTGINTFDWQVNDFEPVAEEALIIYECLVRDFLDSQNYSDLADTLDYLQGLGINAIELMPVQEFEGNNSWGYNPSYHMALDKYYGSPEAFKHFVDEAHRRGIAVILDVVYNHAFSQSPLARLYWNAAQFKPSADNPWLNPDAKHPFNVGYDFNHESAATKQFVKQTLSYWIEEYRIDGFRFDLSKGFSQTFYADPGSMAQYDQGRIDILTDYANHIWSLDPDNYVILEHFASNDEEKELASRGMMLWGNANHAFNQATMGYIINGESDFSHIYHDANNRDWPAPKMVGYMESHDEERLMYRNINFGNRENGHDTRDPQVALDRIATAYSFFVSIPGPKMLWQFGELGFDYSINRCTNGTISENCRLSDKPTFWSRRNEEGRQDLYEHFAAMNHLTQKHAVFDQGEFAMQVFGSNKSMQFLSDTLNIVMAGNFDMKELNVSPRFSQTGTWYELISGDSLEVNFTFDQVLLQPGELRIYADRQIGREDFATSTSELYQKSQINVWPNPAEDCLHIKIPTAESKALELSLIDQTGRSVHHAQNESQDGIVTMYLPENLPSGVYLLGVTGERTNWSSKIIVK